MIFVAKLFAPAACPHSGRGILQLAQPPRNASFDTIDALDSLRSGQAWILRRKKVLVRYRSEKTSISVPVACERTLFRSTKNLILTHLPELQRIRSDGTLYRLSELFASILHRGMLRRRNFVRRHYWIFLHKLGAAAVAVRHNQKAENNCGLRLLPKSSRVN